MKFKRCNLIYHCSWSIISTLWLVRNVLSTHANLSALYPRPGLLSILDSTETGVWCASFCRQFCSFRWSCGWLAHGSVHGVRSPQIHHCSTATFDIFGGACFLFRNCACIVLHKITHVLVVRVSFLHNLDTVVSKRAELMSVFVCNMSLFIVA